jgi:hypothetical protein
MRQDREEPVVRSACDAWIDTFLLLARLSPVIHRCVDFRKDRFRMPTCRDKSLGIANNPPSVRQNVPFQRCSQVQLADLIVRSEGCSPRGCFRLQTYVSMSLQIMPSRFEDCRSSEPGEAVGGPLF